MTKLIVTPIDMAAPGSYRERQKVLRLLGAVQELKSGADLASFAEALDELEAVVVRHAETDDGTPVAEALEMATASDFDQLVIALLGGATVPNASSAS
jgi:hypothetical protein